MEISGELLKFNLDNSQMGIIENMISSYFGMLVQKRRGMYELLYPICFYTDIMEYGPDNLVEKSYQSLYQLIMECLSHPEYNQDDDMVQTCFFSLGCLFYRVGTKAGNDMGKQFVTVMTQFMSIKTADTEDDKLIVDNIISAYMKLYLGNPQGLFQNQQESQTMLQTLLGKMPLVSDCVESTCLNRLLVLNYKSNNSFLTGTPETKALVEQYF